MESQLFISEYEGSRFARQIELSGNYLINVSKARKSATLAKFFESKRKFFIFNLADLHSFIFLTKYKYFIIKY